jgi:hypothetical protein
MRKARIRGAIVGISADAPQHATPEKNAARAQVVVVARCGSK